MWTALLSPLIVVTARSEACPLAGSLVDFNHKSHIRQKRQMEHSGLSEAPKYCFEPVIGKLISPELCPSILNHRGHRGTQSLFHVNLSVPTWSESMSGDLPVPAWSGTALKPSNNITIKFLNHIIQSTLHRII